MDKVEKYFSENLNSTIRKAAQVLKISKSSLHSEIDENKIVFSDEAHFWLNAYVNKRNYRFWVTKNPNISISKSHPEKVNLWAALSVKGIYLYFFDSTVTGNSYKELLETKFFPFAKKRSWVETFHFM